MVDTTENEPLIKINKGWITDDYFDISENSFNQTITFPVKIFLVIARITDDTTEVANINDFLSQISYIPMYYIKLYNFINTYNYDSNKTFNFINYYDERRLIDVTSLSDLKERGYYFIHHSQLSKLQDTPTTDNFYLVNYLDDANRCMQKIYTFDGKEYTRFIYSSGTVTNWVNNIVEMEKKKWLAIGDSITYGVYSYFTDFDSDTATKSTTIHCYVNIIATDNNYEITNKGIRGMGYVASGSNKITLPDVMNEIASDTTEYDLITCALGINDYNTSSVAIGDINTENTLKYRVKILLDQLTTQYQSSKIIFISPLNCRREGTASTKYNLNYNKNNRTLQDVSNAIKEVCDLYTVQYIDLLNNSPININNIKTLLPDKTHPSARLHTLLAYQLEKYL